MLCLYLRRAAKKNLGGYNTVSLTSVKHKLLERFLRDKTHLFGKTGVGIVSMFLFMGDVSQICFF